MPVIDCNTLAGFWPGPAAGALPVEVVLESMQARGVGKSLLWHTAAVFHAPAVGNDLALAAARAHPGELVAAGVLDPRDPAACQAEVARLRGEGVDVYRFCPGLHRYPLSAQYGPLRAVLEGLSGVKLLCVDLGDAPLALDAAPLLAGPTLFTLPAERLGEALVLGKAAPALHAEVSGLLAAGAIEAAVRGLGAERVLFGSASPLQALGSAVTAVQFAELGDADRAALLEGNARRLLG